MSDVSKRFATTRSLDGFSLAVERGAVFGLLGPNGAGKTTTLRILLGLLRFDSGAVRVLDLDPLVQGQSVREQVGVLLEHDGLYDRLSARENLEYHARIRHLGAEKSAARIEELLRSFGLWDRRTDAVATWSKGMRQKLAVARALLHRPPLLLLDEPFSGLDPAAAVELRDRIAALVREGDVTVLMTTHDLAHVEKACTAVAVIRGGRVIASGSPALLAQGSADPEVLIEGCGLTSDILEAMKREGHVLSFRLEGKSARVTCTREARARLGTVLVERGVAIEELHGMKSSLEEAFLSIMAADGESAALEERKVAS